MPRDLSAYMTEQIHPQLPGGEGRHICSPKITYVLSTCLGIIECNSDRSMVSEEHFFIQKKKKKTIIPDLSLQQICVFLKHYILHAMVSAGYCSFFFFLQKWQFSIPAPERHFFFFNILNVFKSSLTNNKTHCNHSTELSFFILLVIQIRISYKSVFLFAVLCRFILGSNVVELWSTLMKCGPALDTFYATMLILAK